VKKLITGILALLLIIAAGCENNAGTTEPAGADTSQGEWELVYEAEDNQHYHALYFTDVNNGWAVGDSGAILHFGDSGYSWEVRESGTESDLNCIHFSSKQRGWIAGSEGTLGITTDGGNTWAWQRPREGSGGSFTDIYFTDESTGWLVNNYGKILHTEDSGVTWVSQDSGTHYALTSVHFLNSEKGWATATNRIVLITTDGGNSWNTAEVNLSLPGGTLFTDVFFIDGMNGWITTTTMASSDSRVTYSPLLHTTDGGESWFVQASPPDKWLRRISLVDGDVGWLLGMSGLYYTEDGGISWSSRLDSGGDPFVDICLVDNLHLWVLSYTGNIYKYATNAEKKKGYSAESWQVGEHWEVGEGLEYGQQAIWGDIMVGLETDREGGQIPRYYISTYDLRSREKERVLELPADRIVYDAPAIHSDKVVWASVDRDEAEQQRSVRHSPMPNWDVFLLNIKTGEVRQLTTDDCAQVHPRIHGNTIVWLDNRHEEGYHNPRRYDVYAYDLSTDQETRLTSTTSAEGGDLAIDGDLVVWTDNRHADPEITMHAGNEPDYNNEIYVYDLAPGQERRVTTSPGNDHYPVIYGNRVAWLRQWSYAEADVFARDVVEGSEKQVSNSRYAAFAPTIHGEFVVWTDARASKGNITNDVITVVDNEVRTPAADIYLYDLRTQHEVSLTSTVPLGSGFPLWVHPVMSHDFVVYELNRQTGAIVYAMKLTDE